MFLKGFMITLMLTDMNTVAISVQWIRDSFRMICNECWQKKVIFWV